MLDTMWARSVLIEYGAWKNRYCATNEVVAQILTLAAQDGRLKTRAGTSSMHNPNPHPHLNPHTAR